jgi:hypothetical protein
MYQTGDRAVLFPDGTALYLGRLDKQIKIRGFRIELGEIERGLLACSGIDEAVVLLQNGSSNNPMLVAYLGSQAPVPPTATQCRVALAAHLPSYMQPAQYVILPALPLGMNGKIDRKALPALQTNQVAPAMRMPTTPMQKKIAGIWAKFLRLEAISLDDHFFALGGHSLLAVQIAAEIRTQTQVLVTVRTFFETANLEEFTHAVSSLNQLPSKVRQIKSIERINRPSI